MFSPAVPPPPRPSPSSLATLLLHVEYESWLVILSGGPSPFLHSLPSQFLSPPSPPPPLLSTYQALHVDPQLSILHCFMQLCIECIEKEEEGMSLQLQQKRLKTIASSCRMVLVPEKQLQQLLLWRLTRTQTQHPTVIGK